MSDGLKPNRDLRDGVLEDTDLAEGWRVWTAGEEKLVLAYRPDVFNGGDFPPPCLPTIYVTHGQRSRQPGRHDSGPDDPWIVTLFLEPEVDSGPEEYPSREAAIEGTRELARRFTAGEVDYRGLYQVPREDYFTKLDELTGREE